jgi:hypothetical protein
LNIWYVRERISDPLPALTLPQGDFGAHVRLALVWITRLRHSQVKLI